MMRPHAASDLGDRVLSALTARVHLVDERLRRRIIGLSAGRMARDEFEALVGEIVNVIALFGGASAAKLLSEIDAETGGALALEPRDTVVRIEDESSVVDARRHAGLIATKLGFRIVQRTKIVTATSELARNIHMYAGTGEIEFKIGPARCPGMMVRASDSGPGILNVHEVLAGTVRSKRGMGLGLHGVKAMADDFKITTGPGRGTFITAVFCHPDTASAA